MEVNSKQKYTKPEISELSHDTTDAAKQTPSLIEGVNPGGNKDKKFGVS